MMKQRISIFLLFTLLLFANGYAQKGIMRLTQQTLMHEVRETPSPLDGQHITVNPPRFMWGVALVLRLLTASVLHATPNLNRK